MTDSAPPSGEQPNNGFFINNGTFTGNFTTPGGEVYTIRKLEPREATDPRDGTVTTIWGGYASARDLDRAAKDHQLQTDFKRTGQRPDSFAPESKEIPLYITLRPHEGGKGFSHIGTFWNSEENGKGGRHTVLARDLEGKSGLRFGGNVLPFMTPAELQAAREARAEANGDPQPDAGKAMAGKHQRVRAGAGQGAKPAPEGGG
jgi:hypothetical protein